MKRVFPFGTITEHDGRFCTVAGNEPKALPGCYGLWDRRNGKWYIGNANNVRARRSEHEAEVRKRKRQPLGKSVDDPTALVMVPLYYLTVDRRLLRQIETGLITALDSVTPNGYNAHASMTEPWAFARLHSPQARAKQTASRQSEEFRRGAAVWLNTEVANAARRKTMGGLSPWAYKKAKDKRPTPP